MACQFMKGSMKIPIFDLHAQYVSLKKEIDSAIKDTIAQSSYINGPANQEFDRAYAEYCGVKHSIGVSSCSAALDMALEAVGVTTGDEVICPAHTFSATAEAIVHRGAKPVFVDIEESTYLIDPELVAQAVTKKTKAILPVHLYGQACDMSGLMEVAQAHSLSVIEDAAQAHGARYQGQRVGAIGDIGCFSFFPAKNLGCYGDGGALTTNNDELAEKMRLLKDHGRVSKYEHQEIGYGERLDTLQAAILLVKLPVLDSWNERRRQIAALYSQALAEKYIVPSVAADRESVFYVYTLRHPNRKQVMEKLKTQGVATGVYYPLPLHLQPAYAYLKYKPGDLPVTERIAQEIFSIPVYPELSLKQVEYIIDRVNKAA